MSIAALAVASMSAHASVNLGPVSPLVPTTFSAYVPVGAFTETYLFTLPVNIGSGYDFKNLPVTIGPIPFILPTGGNLNMAFTAIGLYFAGADNAVGGVGANADTFLAGFVNPPGQTAYSVAIGPNAGGTFYIDIFGKADGSLGGQYSGAIEVTAAPVPEPESYAMLLAGLGVMGAIAIRRNRSKSD